MAAKRLLLALLLTAAWAGTSFAQTTGSREPTLRERLLAGLQARRPSEIAYVDAVVDTVDRDELDEKVVDRVFFWARTKASRSRTTRRGIIYFQPAMQRVADKLRVDIEPDPSVG